MARPDLALAARTGEYNVKDSPYNATGNGTTDDTSAIQSAINDAGTAGGGVVFFPKGTYAIAGAGGTGLTAADNVTLEGAGFGASVLKSITATADTRILSVSSKTGVTIRNLGFEGNSNVRFAIYHWANITGDELLRVQDCRFKSFTRSNARAVYVYPAHAIWIDGCEFQDCIRAIFMEDPDGDVFITNNKIWSPTTGVNPAYGIICQAPTAPLNGPILIAGNTVEDVKADPSTFGADGHGIQLYNVRGARVEGNVVRNCITSGIHVGDGCFGTEVVGNWVADCRSGDGTAIYVELAILSADTSVGTGAQRGATISGNTCTNNNHGIVASYSAATTISDNVVYNNEGNGIFSDSDRLSITNNIVYNNWKTLTPSGDLAKKAGIRNYGSRTAHIGNSCFDNQSTKTQEYGIAINNGTGDQDGKHVVVGNQLQGNGVNGIWEDTGSTNIVANNMT